MNFQPVLPAFSTPASSGMTHVPHDSADAWAVRYTSGAAGFEATGPCLVVVPTHPAARLVAADMRTRHYRITAESFNAALYAHDAQGWHYVGSVQPAGIADYRRLERMAKSQAARLMGSARSAAKAATARSNGARGGRPRKANPAEA